MEARRNPKLSLATIALVLFYGLSTGSTRADQVVADDYIVQGSVCFGVDCADGVALTGFTGLFKENNVRIIFNNTTLGTAANARWRVTVNESANGGAELFAIETASLTLMTTLLSDGRYPSYGCEENQTFENQPTPNGMFVPFGDPALIPVRIFLEGQFVWQCQTIQTNLSERVLDVGDSVQNNFTLGTGSKPEVGLISVGAPAALRVLSNVADPVATTDVLTVGALNATPPAIDLPAKRALVTQLENDIATLQAQLIALEAVAYAAATPSITGIETGDGELTVSIVRGDDFLPILSYDAICTDGNDSFAGSSMESTVVVSGLTNDVDYTCTATITNASATSPSSLASAPIAPEGLPTGLPVFILYEATQ